jgi:flagellar FliL protein
MAKEQEPTDPKAPKQAGEAEPKQPLNLKKLVLFGVPVFLVQLVAIYFLMSRFISPSSAAPKEGAKPAEVKEQAEHPVNIFVVKDIIVNPAGTNGTRFLLTTIGFEVSTPEAQKELERKEVQVRDVLNSILTSKGLDELVSVEQRETLRVEISQKVSEMVKSGSLANVYFSKFIIQ